MPRYARALEDHTEIERAGFLLDDKLLGARQEMLIRKSPQRLQPLTAQLTQRGLAEADVDGIANLVARAIAASEAQGRADLRDVQRSSLGSADIGTIELHARAVPHVVLEADFGGADVTLDDILGITMIVVAECVRHAVKQKAPATSWNTKVGEERGRAPD